MANVNHDTWWIDSGFTIHVTNTLQGLKNLKKPMRSEQYTFSGNKMRSHVEAIRTHNLILGSGFVLVMKKKFYVPSFFRNLVLVSKLGFFALGTILCPISAIYINPLYLRVLKDINFFGEKN